MSESRGDGQPESGGQQRSSGPPGDSKGQPRSSGPPGDSKGQPRSSGPPGDSKGQPRDSGPPGDSKGQPTNGGQPGDNGGQTRTGGQPGGSHQSRRGSDPVADFQRWLVRAGARSMANQVADQVKRTLGQERQYSGDVWDTATNEPPPNEPPECQWCPVCQAARAARMSGPGLGARLADVGGVLASVVQDAFAAFEQVMKTQDQSHSSEREVVKPPSPAPDPEDGGQ